MLCGKIIRAVFEPKMSLLGQILISLDLTWLQKYWFQHTSLSRDVKSPFLRSPRPFWGPSRPFWSPAPYSNAVTNVMNSTRFHCWRLPTWRCPSRWRWPGHVGDDVDVMGFKMAAITSSLHAVYIGVSALSNVVAHFILSYSGCL